MRKAADSLGEVEQLVLTSVLLLGEHAYGLALHEKDQRACRAEERPARNFTSAGGPEERK